MLDVREVTLVNMDLFFGEWFPSTKNEKKSYDKRSCLCLGSYCVEKCSGSLLRETCELKVQVEKNLSEHIYKAGKINLLNCL